MDWLGTMDEKDRARVIKLVFEEHADLETAGAASLIERQSRSFGQGLPINGSSIGKCREQTGFQKTSAHPNQDDDRSEQEAETRDLAQTTR